MEIYQRLKKIVQKFPNSPGVYFFVDKNGKSIYVGKATSLRSRVRSYLDPKIGEKRSPLIERMVQEAKNIKFEKTDSVLEALLLESELIKKLAPKYNSADKDQKSFNYIVITKEDFPRVLIMRERELTSPPNPLSLQRRGEIKEKFGPFPHSAQLKEALKIIRKIFPFRDKCIPAEDSKKLKACFNRQLGFCPGICTGEISKKEYTKTIKHIITFFQGKKRKLVKDLEKEMNVLAKKREFEKANIIKRQISSLNHINDVALIKNELRVSNMENNIFRIEAYDISHISGSNMVGVMVVVENGEANKNEYRMFKIKDSKGIDPTSPRLRWAGDTKALREILIRRFGHKEWGLPDLLVVDGSIAQLNVAREVIKEVKEKKIALVAVTKDERHKAKEIKVGNKEAENIIEKYRKEVILANSESHRFAINFHKKARSKDFLSPQ